MKKINILHIDDEEVWIRTIKRFLQYSEWRDDIEITAAYHYLDAVAKLKENGNRQFKAVLVDYRLEPDEDQAIEKNGEQVVKLLQENLSCKHSGFYLLSATPQEGQLGIFKQVFDKSSGTLKEDIDGFFNTIGSRFIRQLRKEQIKECIKKEVSVFLCGKNRTISFLINDIKKKYTDKCYRVDLTQIGCDFEATIQHLESELKKNKDQYKVVCFEPLDRLSDSLQNDLKTRIQTLGIPVVLTCNDLQKCIPLKSLLKSESDNFCNKNPEIPKLYTLKLT